MLLLLNILTSDNVQSIGTIELLRNGSFLRPCDPVQWAMADPGHADRSVDVKHDCRLAFGSGHGKHQNTLLKTHEKTL